MVSLFPQLVSRNEACKKLRLAAVESCGFGYGREAPLWLTALDTHQTVIDVSPWVRYLSSKVRHCNESGGEVHGLLLNATAGSIFIRFRPERDVVGHLQASMSGLEQFMVCSAQFDLSGRLQAPMSSSMAASKVCKYFARVVERACSLSLSL